MKESLWRGASYLRNSSRKFAGRGGRGFLGREVHHVPSTTNEAEPRETRQRHVRTLGQSKGLPARGVKVLEQDTMSLARKGIA